MLASCSAVIRDGVALIRFIETLVTWCESAQQVASTPLSGSGSMRSANEPCAKPWSRVIGTTSAVGYWLGNSSWSSTTTAGRSLLGSCGREPLRQSTMTIAPAAGRLTTDRVGYRSPRAHHGPQNSCGDETPPAPLPQVQPLGVACELQPRPIPGCRHSTPSPGGVQPPPKQLDPRDRVESLTFHPWFTNCTTCPYYTSVPRTIGRLICASKGLDLKTLLHVATLRSVEMRID